MAVSAAPVNDKREIFGWAMYDWANSAFSTTVVARFFEGYFILGRAYPGLVSLFVAGVLALVAGLTGGIWFFAVREGPDEIRGQIRIARGEQAGALVGENGRAVLLELLIAVAEIVA